MILSGGSSAPRPFPAGRAPHSDPLRRLFGLRLLSEPLPEPLGTCLRRAWMQPRRFDGNQAIQSAGARGAAENADAQHPQAPAAAGVHRQRPAEAHLPYLAPVWLVTILQIELEVSRRVVETPRTEITRDLRNKLLASQGAYLRAVYAALAGQLGEAGALAEFQRLLRKAG